MFKSCYISKAKYLKVGGFVLLVFVELSLSLVVFIVYTRYEVIINEVTSYSDYCLLF